MRSVRGVYLKGGSPRELSAGVVGRGRGGSSLLVVRSSLSKQTTSVARCDRNAFVNASQRDCP